MKRANTNSHPLAKWREAKGITQDEAARLIGVTSMCVSRWERRVAHPRRGLWPIIVHVTGIQPADLVAPVTEAAK